MGGTARGRECNKIMMNRPDRLVGYNLPAELFNSNSAGRRFIFRKFPLSLQGTPIISGRRSNLGGVLTHRDCRASLAMTEKVGYL